MTVSVFQFFLFFISSSFHFFYSIVLKSMRKSAHNFNERMHTWTYEIPFRQYHLEWNNVWCTTRFVCDICDASAFSYEVLSSKIYAIKFSKTFPFALVYFLQFFVIKIWTHPTVVNFFFYIYTPIRMCWCDFMFHTAWTIIGSIALYLAQTCQTGDYTSFKTIS